MAVYEDIGIQPMSTTIDTSDIAYLSAKKVKQRYEIGLTTLYDWTHKTNFPKPYKLGPKLSRWKLSELEEWEQKNKGDSA